MAYRTIRVAPQSDAADQAEALAADTTLDAEEVRVLGSLVEKSIATPDYYPLSLNALATACNQKSSRDPVVSFDEDTILETLDRLMEKKLVRRVVSSDGGRVNRYRHLFFEALRLSQPQGAALCVLMLRGPQTSGEVRQRASRLYDFASLAEVEDTLEELIGREKRPLVIRLARQAGTKESRYAHLLSGGEVPVPPPIAVSTEPASAEVPERGHQRITRLEEQVSDLLQQMEGLQRQFEEFRKQFE